MLTTSGLAEIAALVGDPVRANMLLALMDGRALTASELARIGGITPQTASTHLARMTQANLLTVERQGRHRYHRLASTAVAQMLEGVMAVAATPSRMSSARTRTGPRDQALRRARTCYDHLAGAVAVAIADCMIGRGQIELSPDGGTLTESGATFLRGIGVDIEAAGEGAGRKRLLCRPCLDWSERRHHIGGAIGAAMLTTYLANDWIRPTQGSRAVSITPAGVRAFKSAFALDYDP